MNVYQRGNLWYTDVKVEGQRKRVSTGIRVTEPNGMAKAKLVAAQLAVGEQVCRPALPAVGGGMTLQEAVERAQDEGWGKGKDKMAAAHVRLVVQRFGASTPLSSINEDSIGAWISDLRQQGNNAGTINRKLSKLSGLLSRAVRWRAIPSMPYVPHLEENQRKRTKLPLEAVLRLVEAEQDFELRALWVFMLSTACRLSEALKVEWSDIQGGVVEFAERKGDDAMGMPLTGQALDMLENLRHLQRPFRWSKPHCINRFKLAAARAGIELPSGDATHVLRHSTAMWLLNNGASVRQVQAYLGHSTVTVTERYAKLAGSGLTSAMRLLQDTSALSHLNPVCQNTVTNAGNTAHCANPEESPLRRHARMDATKNTMETGAYEPRSGEFRGPKDHGEVAEWSNAPDSKSGQTSGKSEG